MGNLNDLYAERRRLLAEIGELYNCYENTYFDSVDKVVLLGAIIALRQYLCEVQKQIVQQLMEQHYF